MNEVKYKTEVVKDYVRKILKNHGVPPEEAEVSSSVLVEADMRGIFSHGINSLDMLLLRSIREGGTDPKAVPEDRTRDRTYPIRHIDARGGLGHPVAMKAVDTVKSLARENGFGKVYVFNANHFGVAAVFSERICEEKDLSGRVICTTPAVVKPYGGERNRLGTNLISWSIPYPEGVITIDMSTTIHAISSILKAFLEKMALPFPIFDQDGKETIDSGRFTGPDDFLEKGSMIPLGGLGKGEADVGYKGTGLGILIELDSVIGGGSSSYISPIFHDQRRWIRQIFEAWRIDTLLPKEEALQSIARTVSDIKNEQGKNMLLPGEKEARKRKESLQKGIPYSAIQIERLERIGQEARLGKLESR